jgi:hypothetical protein
VPGGYALRFNWSETARQVISFSVASCTPGLRSRSRGSVRGYCNWATTSCSTTAINVPLLSITSSMVSE